MLDSRNKPTDGGVAPAEPGAKRTRDPEETHSLLREYRRTRSPELRDRLVCMHERLVCYLASRFSARGWMSTEDLVQVGYMGLLMAIERFDLDRGYSFSTYASSTILGVIKHYLRDQTWGLKAPRRLRELGLSLRRHRSRLEQKLGRSPSIAEMAEAAGVSEERLLQAMEVDRVYQPASLDAYLQNEANENRAASGWEMIGAVDPALSAIEVRDNLRRALEQLDPRERAIIYYRFFEEASQTEVAGRLGISQMHVSRLERRALQALKSFLS